MSTSTHDLFDFFKKANSNISDEYTRICRRVNEDPGTDRKSTRLNSSHP